jgi:hypothetical protein
MVGRAWHGEWEERNVRTYCIVLCNLLAGCACVFHLVLVMSRAEMWGWYGLG